MRRRRPVGPGLWLAAASLTLAACESTTDAGGPTVDVRGTWSYTGTQATPNLALAGTLVISTQAGASITGSLTWEESDGVGGVSLKSAQVSGRVVGLQDADFDALATDATRRHVARISANADTMVGVWIATAISRNGSFTAVRSALP
jgi:hypothetical protein